MFPANFHAFIINFIYPHECEYAKGHYGDINYVISENVPGDSGGLTKFGIDYASHSNLDIESLTPNSAELVYWKDFFNSDSIMLPGDLAFCHFDEVVNAGSGAENHILQTSLGLDSDGVLGPQTLLAAWNAYEQNRTSILNAILNARITHYKNIVANNSSDNQFLEGWLDRVNDLKTYLKLS